MPQKESLEKKASSASVMSSRDYGDHKSTTNVNQFSVNKTFLFLQSFCAALNMLNTMHIYYVILCFLTTPGRYFHLTFALNYQKL